MSDSVIQKIKRMPFLRHTVVMAFIVMYAHRARSSEWSACRHSACYKLTLCLRKTFHLWLAMILTYTIRLR